MMLAYAEIPTIIAIISLIATAATLLSTKKPKVAALDDSLQSQATQGAYIPLIIGRGRVGSVFCSPPKDHQAALASLAPQNRSFLGSLFGFAKGHGGIPPQPSYQEDSLHAICVGPASELIAIFQNGETIWRGPITPATHPSGSTILLSNGEGAFTVYWGFPSDPEIVVVDASSKFTHAMKVYWTPKNLGQQRQWPRLEYEVRCPCYSQIASTPSEIPLEGDDSKPSFRDEFTPDSLADAIALNQTGVADGTRKVEFFIGLSFLDGGTLTVGLNSMPVSPRTVWIREFNANSNQRSLISVFPPGGILKAWTSDNGALPTHPTDWFLPTNSQWKYYWIIKSEYRVLSGLQTTLITLGPEVDALFLRNLSTANPFITSVVTNVGLNDFRVGEVQPVSTKNSDGINPIHLVDQLLFARFPYGAGKDRTQFDTRSIEHAAETMQTEKIRGVAIVTDGEGAESALASIMLDIGLLIPWDTSIGKNVFKLLRYEETATDIPAEAVLALPEMEAIQGERPADVIAFTYKDRTRNYREVPMKVFDSGQVSQNENQKARKIPVDVTNDRDSIARLLPRRQQEVLANLATFKFDTNHSTRRAMPGHRFKATATEGAGLQFMVTGVKRQLDSSRVKLSSILDTYNPPLSSAERASFIAPGEIPKVTENITPPETINRFLAFEIPAMLADGEVSLFFAASRRSGRTLSAAVWESRDGTQFAVLDSTPLCISGVLIDELPAAGAVDEDGVLIGQTYDPKTYAVTPDFDADFDTAEDLSLDEDSWRAGKQVLLIGSEIIFLREAFNGDISGLIRGRVGTLQQQHAVGTPFFIVPAAYVIPLRSALFVPGTTLHYKVQAIDRARASDIALVTEQTLPITGKALTPLPVSALRLANFRTSYETSDTNLVLQWNYHSNQFKRTGLGTQGCGQATGVSAHEGHFVLEVVGIGGIVVLEPFFDFTAAIRAFWGLDAMASWTVRITNVKGSFTSSPIEITLSHT